MSERKTWPMVANRTQGFRAVGGSIDIRDGELRFTPHAFDLMTGGKRIAVPLARVTAVGTQPARFALSELFTGGLRARLAVDLDDGTRELFVVWNIPTAIEAVRAELGNNPPKA